MKTLGADRVLITVSLICAVMSLPVTGGCRWPGVANTDERARCSELYRTAMRHRDSGNIEAAILFLKREIETNPSAARAHLDLALILDEHRIDDREAIVHYRLYLAGTPVAQKREMIEGRIKRLGKRIRSETPGNVL